MIALASGCDAVVGSTGQDTSFGREGTLDCQGANVTSQDFVQGTSTDPVRCGPQSQPVSL
ncbi:MAG: hypothetical protein AAFQ64_15495 [Pseudomonadota bacterium]